MPLSENVRDISGVELACKSVASCEIFDKLTREGRLPMFIGVVQVCSVENKTIAETIETLLNHFKGYITKELLTEEMFLYIVSHNIQVAEAWGYGCAGDKVRNTMIKNRAFELAHSTEDIEVIEKYNDLYNKEVSGSDNRNVVNFNIKR